MKYFVIVLDNYRKSFIILQGNSKAWRLRRVMASSIVAPAAQSLVESIPAPTIWVSGLARIDPVGDGLVCFTLYQNVPAPDGGMEHQIVARIIMHQSAIASALQQTVDFTAYETTELLRRAH